MMVGATRADQPLAAPARIGRYEIVRKIGEGGMGTVYEARQDNPPRPVALKVRRGASRGRLLILGRDGFQARTGTRPAEGSVARGTAA